MPAIAPAGGFDLIVVPYELANRRRGMGRGPEHLIASGAESALGGSGAEVRTELVELERAPGSEADGCFALIRAIAERVRSARDRDALPVVLSGSCFAGVGVASGLGDPPAVLWFDAHADFNDPESTVSGYLDGMSLAMLTGGAWADRLAAAEIRPVPESAVVLAGARDLDPGERVRLDRSAITHVAEEELSPDSLLAALGRIEGASDDLYVHIDLDVLDAAEARVNRFSSPGGPTAAALAELVAAVIGSGRVRALSLTAYDPECDPAGAVPPIAAGLLSLLSRERG